MGEIIFDIFATQQTWYHVILISWSETYLLHNLDLISRYPTKAFDDIYM